MIVAAVGMATYYGGSEPHDPIQVAVIERQLGSVYLVPEDTGLVELDGGEGLFEGQVVQTAGASGLGLRIDGVSIRLDADSRLELLDRERLYLQRGRLYVDTQLADRGAGLVVRTDQGSVRHIGTQFIVAIESDELTVSVREGEVRIGGRFYDTQASKGDRVILKGTNRPVVDGITGHGDQWRWSEALSPPHVVHGKTADAFLHWIAAETGYRIVFSDDSARSIAESTVLKGEVDKPPRQELKLRLLTMGLAYEFDDARGEIRIHDPGR